MGESDREISEIDTKIYNLGRELDILMPTLTPNPPTLLEQITALDMVIGLWPNVELHRAGLSAKGLRPAAIQAVLDELRLPLYSQQAVLVRQYAETDNIRADNVVSLRPSHARTRTPKR